MEKINLNKLFLLMSTGILLAACGTDTAETPKQTGVVDTENVETTEGTETTSNEVTAHFDIIIDGESIVDLSQEITVPEGTYLLDAMKDTYEIQEEGTFIYEIEGYEQEMDAGRYWLYYINDEMPSVGAADYELEEGDQIEWRLEDSE